MYNLPFKFKQEGSKALWLGSLVALLIAISPYLFYAYESFPDVQTWETPYFSITSSFNGSIMILAWVTLNKFIPLYLFVIWFLTCKNWWYHVILIPISMYVFQLVTIINNDLRKIDETEVYYIIPIMMVVIPIVYFIRIKLFDKVVHGIDLKAIDEELREYETKEKQLKEETSLFNS